MSDAMSKLERTLQRATTSQEVRGNQPAPQPAAESQEAALREAWLGFGRLLEAAESSAPPQRPLRLPSDARAVSWPARRRRWLWATVSVVVAASLLLALVAARTSNRAAQKPIASGSPQKTIPASAVVVPRNAPGVAARADSKGKPSAAASSLAAATGQAASPAKTSSWDDTVDTRIAQVGRQMALVEQDWRAQADSLDMVQYRLRSVEQEVGEGKF
jgi:hypothetical protein